MNDKQIKEAIEKIKVPQSKVEFAIKSGVGKGLVGNNRSRTKSKQTKMIVLSAALIILTLSSGFFVPSIGKVFAKVPIIGELYQRFYDPIGSEIGKELVGDDYTKSGEKVRVTVSSAYYDTGMIGIVGEITDLADEELLTSHILGIRLENGQKIDEKDIIFDSMPDEQNPQTYHYYVQIHMSEQEILKNEKLSVDFDAGNNKKITIEVPIEQEDMQVFSINQSSQVETDEGVYEGTILRAIKGKKTTMIDYQIKQPKGTGVAAAWLNAFVMNEQQEATYEIPKIFSGLLLSETSDETNDISVHRAIIPNEVHDEMVDYHDIKKIGCHLVIANSPSGSVSVSLQENLPKEFKGRSEKYDIVVDSIVEDKSKIEVMLHLPNLPLDFNRDDLYRRLSEFSIGTKDYIEKGNEAIFEEFEKQDEFFIKYVNVEQLIQEEKIGWKAYLIFDKTEVHGWGKYFDTAKFDSSRAYFGGFISPSYTDLALITFDLSTTK